MTMTFLFGIPFGKDELPFSLSFGCLICHQSSLKKWWLVECWMEFWQFNWNSEILWQWMLCWKRNTNTLIKLLDKFCPTEREFFIENCASIVALETMIITWLDFLTWHFLSLYFYHDLFASEGWKMGNKMKLIRTEKAILEKEQRNRNRVVM